MSSFDFILDGIKFSYSSLSNYETCHYGFKLTYIDKIPRLDNFFGQYGTLIHDTMYQYFSGKLDAFELSQYFNENYDKKVKEYPPPYPMGMGERYIDAGFEFFNNFEFDKSGYDIMLIEEKIDFTFDDGTQFTARPDLVLFDRERSKFILYDYKTSAPFRINKRTGEEIVDKKKLDGYYQQMYIYTYALRNYKITPIDEITLWFTRPSRQITIPWEEAKEEAAIRWLKRVIKKIKKDETFIYDNSNPYFCNNLCSVRDACEYKLTMG